MAPRPGHDQTRSMTEPSILPRLAALAAERPIALFLDVDGTLLDIAPEPDQVIVPAGLRQVLEGLERDLGGALALVSGRAVPDLDRLFDPVLLPAAGVHGASLRLSRDGEARWVAPPPDLDHARRAVAAFVAAHPGTRFEDKTASVVLHYRGRPEAGEAAGTLVGALAGEDDRLEALSGKMVWEIRPRGVDKGEALDRFLATAPFAGRLPVFAGDDVTDLAGFDAARRHGGQAILVGDPEGGDLSDRVPGAWTVADPAAFRALLADFAAMLRRMREAAA